MHFTVDGLIENCSLCGQVGTSCVDCIREYGIQGSNIWRESDRGCQLRVIEVIDLMWWLQRRPERDRKEGVKIQSLWALTLRGDKKMRSQRSKRRHSKCSETRKNQQSQEQSCALMTFRSINGGLCIGTWFQDNFSHSILCILTNIYYYETMWLPSWLLQLQFTMSACDKGGVFLSMCSIAQEHMTIQLREQCSRDRNLGFAEYVVLTSHHLPYSIAFL